MGYYVTTDDGNRYGPADIPTLQQWISEGRIGPQTTLEDEFTGTQIRASLLPELSYLFSSQPPPATGGRSRAPMAGGTASSQAVAALVLGILGLLCCPVLSIPAIILGKQEMERISQGVAPLEGQGLARAGYFLGIVSLVLYVGLAVLYAVFAGLFVAMPS